MKDKLLKIASFLVLLGSLSFIAKTIQSAFQKGLFERYRTVWLYEIDYFSVLMILGAGIIGIPIFLFWHSYKEKKVENELKKQLEEKRNV